MRSVLFLAVLLSLCCPLVSQAQATPRAGLQKVVVRVPFVGCEADGQVGPVKAPRGQSKVVSISAAAAQRLAYYKSAYGAGTLAPRGWRCFGTYGSSGSGLYVGPEPIRPADLFSPNWKGFSGPVIQISLEDGGTSGRFGVARTIARVFPAHSEFVQDVVAEGIEPASSFPSGPYPNDKLTYRNGETVEFQTPGDTEGLGTASRLRKNSSPISGVAMLVGEELSLLKLFVRLPPETSDLTQAIIRQTEHDAVRLGH